MIDGERIADRALAALREATATQLVVANDPASRDWFPGERVVADRLHGAGPLAGIEAALDASEGSDIIVLAWDMPFVPSALLTELRLRGSAGVTAVVPAHGSPPQREPLCAWYGAGALDVCRRLLAAGERRAGALVHALPNALLLDDATLARFGDPARVFTSVDTPEQLAAVGGVRP